MCLFCELIKNKSIHLYENDFVFIIHDRYPVSKGHGLIITKRHVETYFELTKQEKEAVDQAIFWLKQYNDQLHQPNGYNIGINNGKAAGQTIFHVHVHVIPRYDGDMKDPRGGVRGVIPDKQKYG